jgi:hypothetical protein
MSVMDYQPIGHDFSPCKCKECTRHRLTYGTRVFDADGYCPDGYDRDGYDKDGRDVDGFDRYGYNEDGYDRYGYDRDGYDASGYDASGYDSNGYNEDGYDASGYDASGYDSNGYNEDGYDEDGYNRYGWDEDGYNSNGRNSDGYDRAGYDEDGYDEDGYDRDGNRRYDDCCESRQQEFTVRNDGDEPLANDVKTTLELPGGIISDEGMEAIGYYLRYKAPRGTDPYMEVDNALRSVYWQLQSAPELGNQWQRKDGNFAKRLSRFMYETYKVKLLPDVLSSVGNIARDHSKPVSVTFEVTRRLNESAEYFYHDDSCWWGGYADSRCALKTNGGFGMRSFGDYGSVAGRAWVMPLRQTEGGGLTPTLDTMTPDAFIVFNGYGTLEGYAAPRIMAHMSGMTYRKIAFAASPMYVNSGGFLVAPEDIAAKYENSGLELRLQRHADLTAELAIA